VKSTDTSSESLTRLEKRLGYSFNDRALLNQALTHKSHSRPNNERLEFLGDAILGYVIADVLFSDHHKLGEDSLTLLRAELVRRETLAALAREMGLGEFLRLGQGERKSGGRERASILADAVEAIIGAVSLDGGLDASRSVILELYRERLTDVRDARVRARKDAKTRLQELLQARSLALPVYSVVTADGSEHERRFTVSCQVDDLHLTTTGSGRSRRAAEKTAAENMINRMAELD
jgi:ribonuclease-3